MVVYVGYVLPMKRNWLIIMVKLICMINKFCDYISKSFNDLFKEFITEHNKPKVYSTYSSVNYRENFNCYFYEWSNICNRPKIFNTRKEFYQFLSDCKISFSESQREIIDKESWIYCSCEKGEAKLVIRKSYYLMREYLTE